MNFIQKTIGEFSVKRKIYGKFVKILRFFEETLYEKISNFRNERGDAFERLRRRKSKYDKYGSQYIDQCTDEFKYEHKYEFKYNDEFKHFEQRQQQ